MEPPENNNLATPDGDSLQPDSSQQDGVVSMPVAVNNVLAPQVPPPVSTAQSATDPVLAAPEPTAQPTSNLLNTPMPADADDTDLIEREWVDKAKAIVEHTKADPHLQNQEINKMKADYIQKRYNRQIKINEG